MSLFKQLTLTASLFVALASHAIAAPVTYQVDPTHTYPRFSYSHFGLSTQLSSFRKTTGTVTFDAKAKTGQADITIDMTTVNTGLADFDARSFRRPPSNPPECCSKATNPRASRAY